MPINPKDYFPIDRRLRYKMLEWASWYSGDRDQLLQTYQHKLDYDNFESDWGDHSMFWWPNLKPEESKTMLHVPVAGDIAETSANLLFGEPPEIKISEAHEENAEQDAVEAQDRLEEIVERGDLYSELLEAAETAAAMSGAYLKINWDKSVADYPIIRTAQTDNAIPIFKYGILKAVIFHKTLEINNVTHKHIEVHEPGKIYNYLYQWTPGEALVQRKPLSAAKETAGLEDEINTGIDDLTCRYIPNKKPNRTFRGSELGQSDYAGIESLMDSLDETYSMWMRELKLARSRITVPEHWLEKDAEGDFVFNEDDDVYVGMNMGPAGAEESQAIVSQFDIRSQEFLETATELYEKIVTSAGYSPQSFGLKGEASQMTATEVAARENKSQKTRDKKARYFQRALEEILEVALKIDKAKFNPSLTVYKPQVELEQDDTQSFGELADGIEKLNRAQAMSIETKVRRIHPDWTDEQVQAEVERIQKEQGMSVEQPEMRV